MSGLLDTQMRALAVSLISTYGKAASWKASGATSTYDPATRRTTELGATYSVLIAPPAPVTVSIIDGVTVQATDISTSIAASGLAFTPSIGDRVTIDGASYSVTSVSPAYSGELVALYEVTCRK